jgi:hypothetical protein
VVVAVFTVAGYTYGPILGLFLFGLLNNKMVKDKWVPLIAVLSPLLSYLIAFILKENFHYTVGFAIIILNGLLMFIGLLIISKKG